MHGLPHRQWLLWHAPRNVRPAGKREGDGMRDDGSEHQLGTPASTQRSRFLSTTKSKRQGRIEAPDAEAVMTDDDGPGLSPDEQQKLAAIGAALDREAGVVRGLDA